MKNIIATLALVTTILASQYLQDGLYPECSYVIVDEEGWKVHYNQDGKTISMTPSSKHNTKTGKYSFDKFGNLIAYKECFTENVSLNEISKSNTSVVIDIEISLLKNIKYSVFGGMNMPTGDNIDSYEIGPLGGLEIGLGNLNISISSSSLEYEEEIDGNNNNIFL